VGSPTWSASTTAVETAQVHAGSLHVRRPPPRHEPRVAREGGGHPPTGRRSLWTSRARRGASRARGLAPRVESVVFQPSMPRAILLDRRRARRRAAPRVAPLPVRAGSTRPSVGPESIIRCARRVMRPCGRFTDAGHGAFGERCGRVRRARLKPGGPSAWASWTSQQWSRTRAGEAKWRPLGGSATASSVSEGAGKRSFEVRHGRSPLRVRDPGEAESRHHSRHQFPRAAARTSGRNGHCSPIRADDRGRPETRALTNSRETASSPRRGAACGGGMVGVRSIPIPRPTRPEPAVNLRLIHRRPSASRVPERSPPCSCAPPPRAPQFGTWVDLTARDTTVRGGRRFLRTRNGGWSRAGDPRDKAGTSLRLS